MIDVQQRIKDIWEDKGPPSPPMIPTWPYYTVALLLLLIELIDERIPPKQEWMK